MLHRTHLRYASHGCIGAKQIRLYWMYRCCKVTAVPAQRHVRVVLGQFQASKTAKIRQNYVDIYVIFNN